MKRSRAEGGFSDKKMPELLSGAFILLAPTALNSISQSWGLYGVFIILGIAFGVRLMQGGKIHITLTSALCLACALFSLFVLIWADKPYSHLRLVFTLLTLSLAMLLAADYFEMEREKGIGGRLRVMVVMSAFICALWNIIYWCFALRLSLAEPFCAGLGQSDLLGIFMFAGLWCSVKEGLAAKKRRRALFGAAAALAFVLIMSRSLLTMFFGSAFVGAYFVKKKKKSVGIACWAISAAMAVLLAIFGINFSLAPFVDALRCAFTHPLGLGGGGFVSAQGQLQSKFYTVRSLPAGADAASSLGIFGLAAALIFIGRAVYLTFKYKDGFNAFVVLLGIYAFFAPMGSTLSGQILLMCLFVYSEWRMGKAEAADAGGLKWVICTLLGCIGVYGCVLGVGDAVFASALKSAQSKPQSAAQKFALAGEINPFNGESSYNAARLYRELFEEDSNKNHIVNAEYHIKLAVDREAKNAEYYAEYARIKSAAKEWGEAAELYDMAISLAPLWDDLRQSGAACLYSYMETLQKGSVEAQRCYRQILEYGEEATDMEKKKIINDYADKAQPYIRMEFDYASAAEEAEEAGEAGEAEEAEEAEEVQ